MLPDVRICFTYSEGSSEDILAIESELKNTNELLALVCVLEMRKKRICKVSSHDCNATRFGSL